MPNANNPKQIKPIDPTDFQTDRMLKNLQGNIIKGHGRDFTTHIFIEFKPDRIKTATRWIRSFAEEHLTSCKKQLEERTLFKEKNIGGGLFSSFFLTASGYDTLGFKDFSVKLPDPGFLDGLKARQSETLDPDPDDWEDGFNTVIHAMILLADDDPTRMKESASDILDQLENFSEVKNVEYGNVIRNENKDGIEHFGYVDGTSQPLFLKDEIEAYEKLHRVSLLNPETKGEIIEYEKRNGFPLPDPGKTKFNPAAEIGLVLIPDPYVPTNPDKPSYGSYFVFRKLEQNVKRFKVAEEEIGDALFPNEKDESKREIAGAYIIGRFEDGSPVVMDDDDSVPYSGKFNNFDYSSDPSGGRCPHFAHIRKTNPRQDLDTTDHKSHIMARRGIPFGQQVKGQDATEGVGLLFMSYQKSIEKQFEFIQKNWANTETFPTIAPPVPTGVDLIIGHPHKNDDPRTYMFPDPYKSGKFKPLQMKQFVSMRGGEYFFAPSITFLKTIDIPTPNPPVI